LAFFTQCRHHVRLDEGRQFGVVLVELRVEHISNGQLLVPVLELLKLFLLD
jgi:hypothetical protein